MTTVAEQLLRLMHAYGVRTAFGIPGNHTLGLYAALEGSGIDHVTVRHEQAAGFAADGYARASGHPAACFLISGPGLTNAATAMAQALADSIPMLVISSVAPTASLQTRTGGLHELPNQQALARQIALRSDTLIRPDDLPDMMHNAFQTLAHERPGPIHIQVPLDVWGQRATDDPARALGPAPQAETMAVRDAAARLNAANNVILLAGGGAAGAAAFRRLAETLGAPVMTTVNGKGVLPSDHPQNVHGSPSIPAFRDALNRADVVLAIGTEFGETDYDLLMDGGRLAPTGTVIRIDIDADAGPGVGVDADILLTGDAETVIDQLVWHITQRPEETTLCNDLRAATTAHQHYHPDYQAVFDTIARALPDAILVGDSTQPTYYAAWQWRASQPRSYFHSVSGYGTLGYAIPAAIGAQVACPERPVVALIGDGGAQFSCAEFTTAADNRLPVIFLIWNNGGYQEIEHSMTAQGIPADSTRIAPPDFETLAAACRCHAAKPGNTDELSAALGRPWETAEHRREPTVLVLDQDDFIHSPAGQWY